MESASSLSGWSLRKTVAARLWKHEEAQESELPKIATSNFDDELPTKNKRRPSRPVHQIGNLNAQGSSIALAGEIRDIHVNYHGGLQNEDAQKKVKRWLGDASPGGDRRNLMDAKGERTPETCRWIQDLDVFQSWLNQDDASLLWICGGAGTGKTMMSIYLTEPREALQIFHFCHDQNSDSTNAVAVLRKLLYQLVIARPELSKYIVNRMEGPDNATSASTASRAILWSIFESAVQDADLGTFYCVIDGLDECDEDSARFLGRQFHALLNQESNLSRTDSAMSGKSASGQHTKMKLLIVSRDIPGLQQTPQIKLEDHRERRDNDIEALVRHELNILPTLPDFSEDFGTEIRKEILSRADGTFLWAGYALRECQKARSCVDVRESLERVPSGLNPVYRKAISNIRRDDRESAALILKWVTLARGDVSFKLLAEAAEIEADPSLGMDAAVTARVAVCSPLVKTIRETQIVTLGHSSVREFLVVKSALESKNWEDFAIFGQEGHLEIARACIQQIEASRLRKDKIMSPLDENTILAYAVHRWAEHARLAGDQARVLLSEFESFFAKGSVVRRNWWRTYEYNYKTPFGVMPALQKACYFGIKPWVDKILNERRSIFSIGQKVNEHSWSGATPLSCAIVGGHEDIVNILLYDREADLDGTNWFTRAGSLHSAAAYGRTNFVKKLLDGTMLKKAAWVDSRRGGDGATALHLAAQAGHVDTLQVLLDKGADPTLVNLKLETPLHWAAASGQGAKIILPLLDKSRPKFADIDVRNWDGDSPLMVAAGRGWKDTAQVLVKAGADIERPDPGLMTALHFAVAGQHLNTTKYLVDNGANVNAASIKGVKPIHFAAKYCSSEMLQLLLDNGASLQDEDETRSSLFHWAAGRANTDMIKTLHQLGLDVNKLDKNGDTPLHIAARGGLHVNAHRALLDAGGDVNAVNSTQGVTPFMAYIGPSRKIKKENERYARNVAGIHFEYGANFALKDKKKKTPLDYARKNHLDDLVAFLKSPYKPEPKDDAATDSRSERGSEVGAGQVDEAETELEADADEVDEEDTGAGYETAEEEESQVLEAEQQSKSERAEETRFGTGQITGTEANED